MYVYCTRNKFMYVEKKMHSERERERDLHNIYV